MTRNQLLYRPTICAELEVMVNNCFNSPLKKGLFVTGPHGVGKSHTLMNLVLKLMSTGNYLVTFLPNCDQWSGVAYLVEMICQSFGAPPPAILPGEIDDGVLRKFINAVDAVLQKKNKQWVFVFDQVNRLFVKPGNERAKDAGSLAFPFNYIKLAMKPRRISSIISASSNNEMTFQTKKPEGFVTFAHRLDMSLDELKLVFPALHNISEEGLNSMIRMTGRVPLQVSSFLEFDCDLKTYRKSTTRDVALQVKKLLRNTAHDADKVELTKSAVSCLLGIGTHAMIYDRNFCVKTHSRRGVHRYKCLFPLVADVLQVEYWDELLKHVSQNEGAVLRICNTPDITNDVRGRSFEFIVINRCISLDGKLGPT
ncbi:MAG: hypothetical protein ACREBR_00390, partial [bacterium]